MTYFCPALDPPLGGSGRKTTTLVRDLEYFIHTKFHQNPSSGSGEEVENVNCLKDRRQTTDAGQRMITIGHWSLRLLCPKNWVLYDKNNLYTKFLNWVALNSIIFIVFTDWGLTDCTYFPNIVYLRSRWGCLAYVMKNCDPLESGPLFAMETTPLTLCWNKNTHLNVRRESITLMRWLVRIGKTKGMSLLALARSRREVHPEGFPILTSSTWLIIYLAYFLLKPHFNQMFFGLQSIWHIFRVGKCCLTSPSDDITTCVRTHSRTSNG